MFIPAFSAAVTAVVLLTASIFWAVAESDVLTGLRLIAAERWGVVTLLDLGVGLVFVVVWMRLLERRTGVWLAWVLGVVCLGNLATGVFLAVRLWRRRDLRAALLG